MADEKFVPKIGQICLIKSRVGGKEGVLVPALVCGSETVGEPEFNPETKEQVFVNKETVSKDKDGKEVKGSVRVPKINQVTYYTVEISNPDWAVSAKAKKIKAEDLSAA